MCVHGQITDVPVAGGRDHVCRVYRDARELDEAALEVLAGGPARARRSVPWPPTRRSSRSWSAGDTWPTSSWPTGRA
ncbi:Protein of unknown function [Blastococcus saxobsidens DD2]|uniref:Uncharacterized protein n=1 Tax=Blastococcus saxobsidens (strain DD2) TaxID=1146883 RepID=H6RND2_BLASD|nr:Protein of unknown function [Blastococcus saxobsidens DD2]